MQAKKDIIHNDIIEAAKHIFLIKGFAKTSMRDISKKSNVGLSNIYNYFENKDKIFTYIVQPVVDYFEKTLQSRHGQNGVDIFEMRSEVYLRYVIDEYLSLINSHYELLTLLLFNSQGSSLENFKESYIIRSTYLVREYFNIMQNKHAELIIKVSDFSIRLQSFWMFTMFEELLKHKLNPEETEQIVREYMTFVIAGWRELIEI